MHSQYIISFRYHHVYFDNFFSSVTLILELLMDGIYACGTLRSNRIGFPEEFKQYIKKGLPSRGDFQVAQLKKTKTIPTRKSSKSVAVSVWQDNQTVVVVASNCNPNSTNTVKRRKKDGSVATIPFPMAINLYNKYMGGVDLNDQLRGYYSVRSKGRKFYKYIWWFLFDVATTNSYILCKHYSTLTNCTIQDFRTQLAKSLIGDFNGRKRRGRPSLTAPSAQRFCTAHFPMRNEKKSRCYYCYHQRRERHETIWFCNTCNQHLCHNGKDDDCFLLFHTQK